MALTLEYFYHHTQSKYQLCLLTPTANLDRLISWVRGGPQQLQLPARQ